MTQTVIATPTGFSAFQLDARILRAIEDSGYTTPTPIQVQAIPVVLTGQDVMGSAQTGTGKTASFVLPLLQKILPYASTSTSPARHPVRALVLCPTRELAVQVAENAEKYAKYTPVRTAVVFGGMDMKPQASTIRGGIELLIATPGRLLDHLEQGNVSLSQVNYLVLDEADRMLDMGFLPDLQRIINVLPAQRQTLLFSATFSVEIRKLAQSYLKNPITIETAQRNATSNNVTQAVFSVTDKSQKRRALVQLIQEQRIEQAMIFVNTKVEARELTRYLQRAHINAQAIHGDQSQNERLATLAQFKNNSVPILVATDVAARGLDIAQMPCVVNFDLPYNAEDYVHRIGRTGRAGASGQALSITTPQDEKLLIAISKLIKTTFTPIPLESQVSERPIRKERTHEQKNWGRDNGRGESKALTAAEEELNYLRRKMTLSNDPFFERPYEPSMQSDEIDSSNMKPALHKKVDTASHKKPAIAALFVGKKR